MITDPTLIQDFSLDSLEQLSVLLDKKPTISASDETLLRYIQSVKVGAMFWGFENLTVLSTLLKNTLIMAGPLSDNIPLPLQDKLQTWIQHNLKSLQKLIKNLETNIESPIDALILDYQHLDASWFSIDDIKQKPLLTEIEARYYQKQQFRLFDTLIYLDDDLIEKGRDPLEFLQQVESVGDIVATRFDLEHFPTLPGCLEASIPIRFYVATGMNIETFAEQMDIPETHIQHKPWPKQY